MEDDDDEEVLLSDADDAPLFQSVVSWMSTPTKAEEREVSVEVFVLLVLVVAGVSLVRAPTAAKK